MTSSRAVTASVKSVLEVLAIAYLDTWILEGSSVKSWSLSTVAALGFAAVHDENSHLFDNFICKCPIQNRIVFE